MQFKTTKKLFFIFLLLSITSLVRATNFAFTPFTGYRASDSLKDQLTEEIIDVDETSSFGFIMSMKRDRASTYDLYFSRQDTNLRLRSATPGNDAGIRLDYIHLGGTVDYEADKLYPFATGGLGITRLSATDRDLSSETKFSMSIGGGLKIPLAENVGIRLETRVLGINTNGNTAFFCSNGQCTARFNGSFFLQFEANLGLSIAF